MYNISGKLCKIAVLPVFFNFIQDFKGLPS
jgi:hypothetical protein